jgi:SAM-dependent methyltransferase
MNETTANFHLKNAESGYLDQYVADHMPRVKWVVERFGLDKIENQRVIEVGVGRGLYFSQMSPTNIYVGLDGAIIPPASKLCPFQSLRVDLNREDFGMLFDNDEKFDWLICSETLEHVANVNNVMIQMKNLLKPNAPAIFTIPHISVTHPVVFPGVFYPEQNFQCFIEQYAWIVEDYALYDKGWWTCCFKVRNAPMAEQRPLFAKQERKFWGQNPEAWTNL